MFESILDYILRTNFFNFIIFAGIIIFLCIKFNVSGILEQGKTSVEDNIKSSDDAKKDSELKLEKIKESVAHINDDIDNIIKESKQNADIVGAKILSDAEKTVVNIKNNSMKIIENKTAIIKSDIMKKASLATIEIARSQIVKELNNNKELHNRFIDESIETINGVDI